MARAPRGYYQQQYPLLHLIKYKFDLHAENETKNSMIIPLIRTSQTLADPPSVEVNPHHPSYAEESGATIHMGSIVPRMKLFFQVYMTKGAIETDKLRTLRFDWMPIYCAFLDDLEAEDENTATQIEDILELQHATDNKDVYPIGSTIKSANYGGSPLSTVGYAETFAEWGLTTNSDLEYVAFQKKLWEDAMRYYTNKGKLRKVCGRYKSQVVSRDRMFKYYSANYTHPTVKRGNPYTFCGILFHVEQAGSFDQQPVALDTTDIAHLHVMLKCTYEEWNPSFTQEMA